MSKGKWTDEKRKAWSEKCRQSNCNNKTKTKEQLIENAKSLRAFWEKNPWSEENSKKHSEAMKRAVLSNPDSYSKNNVSGRAKIYKVNDSYTETKVKGKWELRVAELLNANGIKWTNNIEPYKYFWNNNWHLYYPDFYLIEKDILLEVKGYQVERDYYKWNSVLDKKLIILKQKEIDNLEMFFKENNFLLPFLGKHIY